jgi:hypothetical protein
LIMKTTTTKNGTARSAGFRGSQAGLADLAGRSPYQNRHGRPRNIQFEQKSLIKNTPRIKKDKTMPRSSVAPNLTVRANASPPSSPEGPTTSKIITKPRNYKSKILKCLRDEDGAKVSFSDLCENIKWSWGAPDAYKTAVRKTLNKYEGFLWRKVNGCYAIMKSPRQPEKKPRARKQVPATVQVAASLPNTIPIQTNVPAAPIAAPPIVPKVPLPTQAPRFANFVNMPASFGQSLVAGPTPPAFPLVSGTAWFGTPSLGPKPVWQFLDVIWQNFDDFASQELERAYQMHQRYPQNPGLKTKMVKSGLYFYLVNFEDWTQKNTSHPDGTVRKVARTMM